MIFSFRLFCTLNEILNTGSWSHFNTRMSLATARLSSAQVIVVAKESIAAPWGIIWTDAAISHPPILFFILFYCSHSPTPVRHLLTSSIVETLSAVSMNALLNTCHSWFMSLISISRMAMLFGFFFYWSNNTMLDANNSTVEIQYVGKRT